MKVVGRTMKLLTSTSLTPSAAMMVLSVCRMKIGAGTAIAVSFNQISLYLGLPATDWSSMKLLSKDKLNGK
jgi:hypothetical protein